MNLNLIAGPVVCLIATPYRASQSTCVKGASFDDGSLKIRVASAEWEAEVSFSSWYGFRVLDELDLTEFWSQCSLKKGWLFEVFSGGWKELELRRPHFVSGRQEWVREFLVVGINECVSVMSKEQPVVSGGGPSRPLVKPNADGGSV